MFYREKGGYFVKDCNKDCKDEISLINTHLSFKQKNLYGNGSYGGNRGLALSKSFLERVQHLTGVTVKFIGRKILSCTVERGGCRSKGGSVLVGDTIERRLCFGYGIYRIHEFTDSVVRHIPFDRRPMRFLHSLIYSRRGFV